MVSTGSDLDSNAILAQVDVRLLPPAASHIKQQQKQQQHNIGTTERPVNSGSRSRHEYQHKYACFTRCQRLTPSLSRKTRSRAVRWGRLHLETQKKKEKKTQLRATSLKLIFAKCVIHFPDFPNLNILCFNQAQSDKSGVRPCFHAAGKFETLLVAHRTRRPFVASMCQRNVDIST